MLGGLLALVLGAFLVLSLLYSPTYVGRVMFWQDADVEDHTRFASRSVDAAPSPFRFDAPADPTAAADAARAASEASAALDGSLDDFLVETDTQAFIVIRDGEILFEEYVGDFERDSIATSFSTAKSYLSALVGIAIGEGAIGSVDDPITDYLPELLERDERFAEITIRHLLDMASGIRYEEAGFITGDDTLTYYFDDMRRLALERTEIDGHPGERWHYNNYNPLLVGLILERATGMAVADYLEDRLWRRIGTEFPASWSLDREDGFEKMESGINARPIDFAKLGQLYLDGGSWNGEQVVPGNWVNESTSSEEAVVRPAYYPPRLERAYGSVSHRSWWWRVSAADGDEAFAALGNHGQLIFVSPADRVVIVRSGERSGIPNLEWLGLFTDMADALGTP